MNRLDEIKARAAAATEGPWFAKPNDVIGGVCVMAQDITPGERARAGANPEIADLVLHQTDAEFIAHARTDVPVLIAAVEAVLELHQPIDPDSIGRSRRCCSCSAVYGNAAYPCDTVTAIQSALGEDA